MRIHIGAVMAILVASHHCTGQGGWEERPRLKYDVTNHGKIEANQKEQQPNLARYGHFRNAKPSICYRNLASNTTLAAQDVHCPCCQKELQKPYHMVLSGS